MNMVSEAVCAIYIVSLCFVGYPAVPFIAWCGLYVILDRPTETSELDELITIRFKRRNSRKGKHK